ncbi:unannotated protein [freshwater metagenome]|jgi:uncharacterized membrane protein|uniref:Unannotated protein n=1 Tax=freshwater metagenome TaxID=449393 RepID=A0A6J7KGN3_9ZZZZ|nr:AzlD domain-containing protein [Actinomycetota bacterium]
MNLWLGILVGSAAVYSWKFIGHLVPRRLLDNPRIAASANYLTIALMAALVGIQTFTKGQQLVIDARLAAVLMAVLLTALRVPFLIMVASSAALAALIRLFF